MGIHVTRGRTFHICYTFSYHMTIMLITFQASETESLNLGHTHSYKLANPLRWRLETFPNYAINSNIDQNNKYHISQSR